MKRSTRRILTTHTGSLPRPKELLGMITAKEAGEAVDRDALNSSIRSAVDSIVHQQAEAGVDIINDGEMSKPGYSNYIKDRMTGFGGESIGLGSGGTQLGDLQDFPEYAARLFPSVAAVLKTPACTGPISYQGTRDLDLDIANLKKAAAGVKAEEVFMSAASPGVISLFLPDHHYGSHDAYLAALADAMKTEYRAIHDAGLLLQVDCPDLAMGRHIQFNDLSVAQFRKKAALHVEALNHALAGIPADSVRLHLCWGNYEGPHHRDVPLKDIVDVVLKANVGAISFEGSNPRHEHEWRVWEGIKLGGKALIPGVLDSSCNFIEHPDLIAERIVRLAKVVGRENVMAGSDCGFSTFAGFVVVDPAITWAKLASMAEGARKASRELWRKATRAAASRKPAKRERGKSSKARARRRQK
ncbi:MAG TPA: cobalamin-independent methionine synthase II family protein [Candidatus Binataceae bacterium]|nr:cobalamin-independent methionine synthase II family protein [Candidatus Binataceae bacterium]